MSGRPSKLTAALVAKLDAIADDGRSLKAVCQHLDIATNTWRAWEAAPPIDEIHAAFLNAAVRVRARANAGMTDKAEGFIEAALDDPDIRADKKAELAMQYLRLVGPHRVEISGRDGGAIDVAIDARAALLELLKRNAAAAE